MKKFTFLKMMLLMVILVGSTNVFSQLLVENFDYTIGSTLTTTTTADPATGWAAHSGNGTANIQVTSGLTFAGYAGSGIGGAANVNNNGQDINKTFTAQTSGVVYAAFIISAGSTNAAVYFFHLSQASITSTAFISRVWINAAGNGVGIGTSAPTSYVDITPNQPTLLVVKYDIASKVSSLYVLNAYSATEPTTASATFTETATLTDVGSVALRQNSTSQKIVVDGIRVGTTWADAVAPEATTPTTTTPQFSVLPGNYVTSQNVELTSETGASIYYTIDGTAPNNTGNGTLYTTAITVNSTTTIRAIAYKSGSNPSAIATGIFTYPTDISDINTLRSSSLSGFYRLTGESFVTLKSAGTNSRTFYLQDATAAIVMYDGNNNITNYNLGDGVKNIYCTLSTYNGMLQIVPYSNPGAASSTGNTVTPKVITLDQLSTYPAQLVTVNRLTISDLSSGGNGNFQVGKSYPISDGTNTGNLRTAYSDLDYIGKSLPTLPQDITGVVLNTSASVYTLVPRSLIDISTGIFTPKTESLNVSVQNGKIVFDAAQGETVEVFNAVGQRLLSQPTVEGKNELTVVNKGATIVRIANRVGKVML